MTEKKFYVTTFCNFAHDLKTGSPIKHECYTLHPKALALEMAGEYQEIIDRGGMKKGCFFAGKRTGTTQADVNFSDVLGGK